MKFLNIIILFYIIDCYCNCASLPGFEELENKLKDTKELIAKKRGEIIGMNLNPRVGAAIKQQKDSQIEQKKKRCEFCRNLNRCKNQGKCELCEKICSDFPEIISKSPIDPITINDKDSKSADPIMQKLKKRLAIKENEPIVGQSLQRRFLKEKNNDNKEVEPILQSRFGGGEENTNSQLADWQNRFYTVAQFTPGPQMNLLMRLAKVKDKTYIDKLIILAKAKSKSGSSTHGDPIIVDTAKVIVPPDHQPPTLHRVDGSKVDKDNSELASGLINNLDEAMKEKKKTGSDGRLTPQEIDKIIDKALESVQNEEDNKIVGDSPDDKNNLTEEKVTESTPNLNVRNLNDQSEKPNNESVAETTKPELNSRNDDTVGEAQTMTTTDETVACSQEEEIVPLIPPRNMPNYRNNEPREDIEDEVSKPVINPQVIQDNIENEKVGAVEDSSIAPTSLISTENTIVPEKNLETHIQKVPEKNQEQNELPKAILISEEDKKTLPAAENQEKINTSEEDDSSEEKGPKPTLKTRIQERLKLMKNNKNKPEQENQDHNISSPEDNSSEEKGTKPTLKSRIQERLKNKNPTLFKNVVHDKSDPIESAPTALQPESTLGKSNPNELGEKVLNLIKPNKDQLNQVEETLVGAKEVLEKLNADAEKVSKILEPNDEAGENPKNSSPLVEPEEPSLKSRVATVVKDKDFIGDSDELIPISSTMNLTGVEKAPSGVNLADLDTIQITDAEKQLINRNKFEPENSLNPQPLGARTPKLDNDSEETNAANKIAERKKILAAHRNERKKKLEDRLQKLEARRRSKDEEGNSEENKLQNLIKNLKNRNSEVEATEPDPKEQLEQTLNKNENNVSPTSIPSLKERLQQRRNKNLEKNDENNKIEGPQPTIKDLIQQRLNKNKDHSQNEKSPAAINILKEEEPLTPPPSSSKTQPRPPLIQSKPKIVNPEESIYSSPTHPLTKPAKAPKQSVKVLKMPKTTDQTKGLEPIKKAPLVGKSEEKPTLKELLQQRLDERKSKLPRKANTKGTDLPIQDNLVAQPNERNEDTKQPQIENRNQFEGQPEEIVGLSPEEEEVLHNFGKLVPVNENGDIVGNPKDANNVFFLGKGIKLPLKMQANNDGSLQLSVDINKLCNCANSTCPANLHSNNIIKDEKSDVIGAGTPTIDENDNLNSKELLEKIADDLSSNEKKKERKKRSTDETTLVENKINKSNKDDVKEENDEISQIKDLYKFQLLEDDLESKLEKLNAKMKSYFDQFDITKNTYQKHDVDSEIIHKRVKLVNDMLKWMKSLYSKK